MKDQERKGFLSARDAVLLMDEQREALRRRRVANGTWNDQVSYEEMKKAIAEIQDTNPEFSDDP